MPKKLENVKITQSGPNRDGTKEKPFVTGSILVELPHTTPDGAVKHPLALEEFLEVEPCPDPILAPKFRWVGLEGLRPICDLPVVHNTLDDPASFRLTIKVNVASGFDYEFSKVLYFYTESCPLHRTDQQQNELHLEMWRRRKANLGRFFWKVVCEGGHSQQVDKAILTTMREMNPTLFKKGMMSDSFAGDRQLLFDAIEAALDKLSIMTSGSQPVNTPEVEEKIYFEKQSVLIALGDAKTAIRKIEVALENEGIG